MENINKEIEILNKRMKLNKEKRKNYFAILTAKFPSLTK